MKKVLFFVATVEGGKEKVYITQDLKAKLIKLNVFELAKKNAKKQYDTPETLGYVLFASLYELFCFEYTPEGFDFWWQVGKN